MNHCGCCLKEKDIVGVASIPFIAMSIAWCRDCLAAGAIPYSACVTNTALCEGWEHTNEAWQELVKLSLTYHGKSFEEFERDVAQSMKEMP